MKIFADRYEPIKITIKNIKGEEFFIESKFLSAKKTREIEILINDDEVLNTDKIYQMMIATFGKDKFFWEQFSLDLLNDLTTWVAEENKKKAKA